TLFATFDGGAHWRVVRGGLPEIAPVEFLSPTEAWQAGGPFGFALFHSVDGGRLWARARLPAPAREHGAKGMVGLPAGHPGRLLVPVTFRRSGHVELAVYRSVDRGRRWRLASLIEGGSTCRVLYGLAPALSASFATGRIWWASVYRSRRWWAYRTSNAGRTWQASPIARASQAGSCPRPAEIQAIDGRAACF